MKDNNSKSRIIISSINMLHHLVRCGHNIVAVSDNIYHPERKVFLFEDNEDIRRDMSSYKK